MVTENGDQGFLLKMDTVGPKLHQISPKTFCSVYNTHTIALQCYVYFYEVLCPCSGQDSYERDRDPLKFKYRSGRSVHSFCSEASCL
jgi:hypothetical protein